MTMQGFMTARDMLLKAVESGPVEKPDAVQDILRDLASLSVAASMRLNTTALEEEISAQFSTREFLYREQLLEPQQAERWVSVLRWVVQELQSWTPHAAHAFLHLRILLATLAAFDSIHAEMDLTSPQFSTSVFSEGLQYLLEHAEVKITGGNSGLSSLWSEMQRASLAGDYERIATLRRRFGIDIPLPPDIRLVILFLQRINPGLLASHIEKKKDAFFSYVVCGVLQGSVHQFALSVDDIAFKFFSAATLADIDPECAPSDAVEVFCELLLQVARSDHWASWLHAFYKYPQGNRVSEQALPCALAQLEARHWKDFVSGVQLWTHFATVAPVADIFIGLYKRVGSSRAREMWRLAYGRWDKWDYGREESQHMSAPAACSFDFPVAMYYAHIEPDTVKAEKERLLRAISSVEQTWFFSRSDLIAQRNRFLSRLRLVCHGQALASGATDPLPPPDQSEGEYAALRYR